MDDTTRQMIGACYIAACDAAGLGVLDQANLTLKSAIANRAISDPVARQAIETLVASCEPDTAPELAHAMANLSESTTALSRATGNEAIARLTSHIARRIGRITPLTPVDEIKAIIDMADALEHAVIRLTPAVAA